ncbi:hypothetical protein BH10PLA1_BH10PLA1_00510 [soil metagenome]
MAFNTSVWFVDGSALQSQERIVLDSERRLEDWIAADLSLLGEELLLIDRQTRTTSGPLDILAIDADGSLVIAELKRDRTPREVVAQILDYASWVRERSPREIDEICRKRSGKSLAEAFREKFEFELPEGACKSHRMLVVAAELDDSSERIIRYLQDEHEIDINAVFFSVYRVAGKEMLIRAWLADPIETQERAERKALPRWSGVWYVNHDTDRDWEQSRKYGFISAGGAPKYYEPLRKLQVGDTMVAYQKKSGYLGVGKVRATSVPADEFKIAGGRPLMDVAPKLRGRSDDNGERVVAVDWLKTVPVSEAKTFTGAFANQNVVCKLRHGPTIEFLRQQFGLSPSILNGDEVPRPT